MFQCCKVAMFKCSNNAKMQCYNVAMLQSCNYAILTSCNVEMLQHCIIVMLQNVEKLVGTLQIYSIFRQSFIPYCPMIGKNDVHTHTPLLDFFGSFPIMLYFSTIYTAQQYHFITKTEKNLIQTIICIQRFYHAFLDTPKTNMPVIF